MSNVGRQRDRIARERHEKHDFGPAISPKLRSEVAQEGRLGTLAPGQLQESLKRFPALGRSSCDPANAGYPRGSGGTAGLGKGGCCAYAPGCPCRAGSQRLIRFLAHKTRVRAREGVSKAICVHHILSAPGRAQSLPLLASGINPLSGQD